MSLSVAFGPHYAHPQREMTNFALACPGEC